MIRDLIRYRWRYVVGGGVLFALMAWLFTVALLSLGGLGQ